MTSPSVRDVIASIDVDRLAAVCRQFGVVELSVFGSTSRGDATESSDVDLLYVLGPEARLGFSITDLEDALAEVFGRPVDLVAKRPLHPLLAEEVLHDALVVYAA